MQAQLEFGAGSDIFFIVLFVVAGASLHLKEIVEYAPLALAYVGVRTGVKVLAVLLCGRVFGYPWRQSAAAGLALVPMAGLAIGLVHTTQELLPAIAVQVGAIVLASVAVFETIGPPLVAYALRMGGAAVSEEEATAAERARTEEEDEDAGSTPFQSATAPVGGVTAESPSPPKSSPPP